MRFFRKIKLWIIIFLCVVISIPTVVMPVTSAIVYEVIFSRRYETPDWLEFSVNDYENLEVQRSDFISDGVSLAGYRYSKSNSTTKGVVVIAHGMGGGGHNSFLPLINYFTENGYQVFAYDACGNDESEGNSVKGLPRGVIDLDNAIKHIKSLDCYKNLPIMLLGHSWGGYSVGSALYLHPDVKSAVIISGFNESEDLLLHYGESVGGKSSALALPYLSLYENIKFGKNYSEISAVDAMKNTSASIMIVHSKDDTTVPIKYGYDTFFCEFSQNNRFQFVLYENRGHDSLFYSDSARAYRQSLNESFNTYLESNGLKYSEETKSEFMKLNLNKNLYFELDFQLMNSIIQMFDSSID